MASSFLTISMVTKEALRVLKNELGFAKGVNRQYDDSFGQTGAKIGSTLNIRKPNRYYAASGAALVTQDSTEASVPLTLSNQIHVGMTFSSKDLTLSIDEFSDRYVKPAIATLANKIDVDGLALANQVANSVGTYGTAPANLSAILAAGQKLDENGTPVDGMRSLVLNPAGQASMVGSLSGLFQSSEKIASQYEKGRMGEAAGFTFKMDQNVNAHTVGTYSGTPLVNGAGQTGSTLITNGWGVSLSTLLNVGDVFTIAGVYTVNPQSKIMVINSLKQFVVTAGAASDATGNSTISIFPAIVTSGAYQNVSSGPAAGAAITVLGASGATGSMNLAYHRDAFVLGMADLALPSGVEMAARATDPDAGLSLRIVRAYDINSDNHPCRIDMLYGWAALYPELACRIHG